MYKNIFMLIFCVLFLCSCSSKKLMVAALKPSKINHTYKTIAIPYFHNDNINQRSFIQSALANKVVNNQKVFTIKESLSNVDTILRGEVLESSLNISPYFDDGEQRCVLYKYNRKTKTKECIKYRKRKIPCQIRNYRVLTKISLINPTNDNIIFDKIYTKTHQEDECFEDRIYYYPYLPTRNDKYKVNSNLAQEIAKDISNDLSPHYEYFDIKIMDTLKDDLNYTDEQKKEFELIVNLIENNLLEKAKEKLRKFDSKSVEAIYNLALIYEAQDKLLDANKVYKTAKTMTEDKDYLLLINTAILRTKQNLENKIKAKSQLKGVK